MPCGRTEWEQALLPVTRAINRDDKNFCAGYWPVTIVEPGQWRLVINFVEGGDPDARTRVERLIQAGAPVEWRQVKYSCGYLSRLQEGAVFMVVGPVFAEKVNSVGVDAIADAVSVETRGEQPELAAELKQKFGDAVVVVVGPAELPQPI